MVRIHLPPAGESGANLTFEYVDGELDPIETANWFPKIYRKECTWTCSSPAIAATTR